MTFCAAVRALAALAAQCRDAVTFCRTPHAGADRLWAETSRRDGADRLAEQEAETEVTEPDRSWIEFKDGLGRTVDPGLFRGKPAGHTLPRQPAYPPFNPLNHESSSVDGEAATVAGPPAEDRPVASVSADLDATGLPSHAYLAWAAWGLRDWINGTPCDAPGFWRETADHIDPEK